ncbi:MAG: sulfatase, partial [Pirellulales bacterium]|nr:sulfatase [Pirellulales bacterium]
EHSEGAFGMPHLAFVEPLQAASVDLKPLGEASVTVPQGTGSPDQRSREPVRFTIQVDRRGDGRWTTLESVQVAGDGYVAHHLPPDLEAVWLRLITDRDCTATAFLHQTAGEYADGTKPDHVALFGGLAEVEAPQTSAALLYAAKRNRNLRLIAGDGRHYEFTKAGFEFKRDPVDENLKSLLHVEPEFSVDRASVLIEHQGRVLRLPKGNAAYSKPFASGWPRASREVQSERHLANIHGTFYEAPLVTNGAPPAWNRMRPVSSHSKQITDFCSWNGLLVLAGARPDAAGDGHVFADDDGQVALWFGGIDDLWKLGKPIGDGGPWLDSQAKAGVPSDPYLMTGYDKKSVRMSHQSSQNVTFTLQVDIDGTGLWCDYRSFQVEAGQEVAEEFPEGFSACWVRVVCDQDTTASCLFRYR